MMAERQAEKARYDLMPDFYFDAVGTELGDPTAMTLVDLLGDVRGMRILDLACGHGRITRELARRGARVTGIDISVALLGRALSAEAQEPLGIIYVKDTSRRIRRWPGRGSAGSPATTDWPTSTIWTEPWAPFRGSSHLADGSRSRSCIPASPGGTRPRRAAGRTRAVTTSRAGGWPGTRVSGARSVPTTACSRPTSTPSFAGRTGTGARRAGRRPPPDQGFELEGAWFRYWALGGPTTEMEPVASQPPRRRGRRPHRMADAARTGAAAAGGVAIGYGGHLLADSLTGPVPLLWPWTADAGTSVPVDAGAAPLAIDLMTQRDNLRAPGGLWIGRPSTFVSASTEVRSVVSACSRWPWPADPAEQGLSAVAADIWASCSLCVLGNAHEMTMCDERHPDEQHPESNAQA